MNKLGAVAEIYSENQQINGNHYKRYKYEDDYFVCLNYQDNKIVDFALRVNNRNGNALTHAEVYSLFLVME